MSTYVYFIYETIVVENWLNASGVYFKIGLADGPFMWNWQFILSLELISAFTNYLGAGILSRKYCQLFHQQPVAKP